VRRGWRCRTSAAHGGSGGAGSRVQRQPRSAGGWVQLGTRAALHSWRTTVRPAAALRQWRSAAA
jgi:hypothetical protein